MSNTDSSPKYIPYSYYDEVIREYDKYKNLYDRKYKFDEIINDLKVKREKLKLPEEIFEKLHRILRNDNVFYKDMTGNYCSYVNYLLNDEVRNKYQRVNESNFDIFDKFVVMFNMNKHKKENETCYGYMKYLNDDVYRRMTTLYHLYAFYNNLKSSDPAVSNNACNALPYYVKIYNDVINKYYDSDLDLHKKISDVKDLIVNYLSNHPLKCKKNANFYVAKNFLLAEKLRKEKEQQEALEREQAKKEALEREKAESKAALKSMQEQYIEFPGENQKMPKTIEDIEEELIQGNTPIRVKLEDLTTSGNIGGQKYSHVLSSPIGSYNLGKSGDFGDRHKDQSERIARKTENEGTSKDRSFLSSGIAGSITDFIGDVDPVPVVGVSGGMGALYLLLKYTPVGSFFGGGRRQMRQIRRNVEGLSPGEFPYFYEYDGGNVGYGPMYIPNRAE